MIAEICEAWEQAATVERVETVIPCRTGVLIGETSERPRFAYVSAGSPIEQILGSKSHIVDRAGNELGVNGLAERLLNDEVACVLAPPGAVAGAGSLDVVLPHSLIERRSIIRHQNVLARFLLRQIGLEEVSSHRGAHAQLYSDLASMWSLDLAMCIDPAMLLTLGADRQRYVDANFTDRATDRLPRALGRLSDLGVRSYPRLVIV